MPNEIRHRHTASAASLYAVLTDPAGRVWTGAAWQALTLELWPACAIGLAESPAGSRRYLADFPPAIDTPGHYEVELFAQAGPAPTLSDECLARYGLDWNGSASVGLGDLLEQDVDSTGAPLSLRKALEVLVAARIGAARYDAASGTWTVNGRDGQTPVARVTLTGSGNREASEIL